MAIGITAPRGTKDVLPGESGSWQYAEEILRRTAADFGFSEIRVPTFEHTELFHRSVGDTTDVVQKEMYTFEDKGGRSVTLRPEATASIVRAFLEHGLHGGGLPVKVYGIVPNFRYEKPQAGRLREFHQFNVECFGPESPAADAELIALADTALRRLGITGLRLELNSIGCPQCRPLFHAALRAYFAARESDLCSTCHGRLEKNPMRILDCKTPSCADLTRDAPSVLSHLCGDCASHFDRVQSLLGAMGIACSVNPRIVRGLDYYTRTVFEFVSDEIGSQGAVLGGGRYDGLVAALGGPATPALGFAAGMERLLMVMQAQGASIPQPPGCCVFLAALGEGADTFVQVLAHRLRGEGIAAERDTLGRGLKAQMKYADRIGARFSMVIGDDEMAAGRARLRDMRTGTQEELSLIPEEIAAYLKKTNTD